MSSLAELRNEHAELVTIVKQLETLIDRDTPPACVDLFNVRRRLSSLLIAHLKAEDWVLYPPLLSSDDPQVAATARQFVDEMGGLAQAYTVFSERWDALSIESNWAGYRKEAGGIIEALTNRIIRENRDLYPLLDRIQRAA
ncbi:MAG TPA: hemerythrin domain-containing protein [Sphingomicrobium sp.]